MKDRLLKFDTLVAACALLMSSVTAGAMVYQTHVIQEQYSATVWPYLNFIVTYNPKSISAVIENDGAGPALIRSAQLSVDGNKVSGWEGVIEAIVRDLHGKHGNFPGSMSSVDASTAIRPGSSYSIVSLLIPDKQVMAAARRHAVTVDLCYCSINSRCWRLRGVINSNSVNFPHETGSCPIGPTISASFAP